MERLVEKKAKKKWKKRNNNLKKMEGAEEKPKQSIVVTGMARSCQTAWRRPFIF